MTKESLRCPALVKRDGLDQTKSYEDISVNIKRFRELGAFPFKSSIPEKLCNASSMMESKGKFHNSCKFKIGNLKLERAEKKYMSSIKNVSEIPTQIDQEINTSLDLPSSSRISQDSKKKRSLLVDKQICFFLREWNWKAVQSGNLST